MTQKPTDTQFTAQTAGNYVLNQPATGRGFRNFPYSFDMTVSPVTLNYFNVGGAADIYVGGHIWAQTLWDMHWLLSNKYGYDPDMYNGRGGNNVALKLVVEAMKLQPVDPSFIEARDAILAADTLLFRGLNHKEIWEAFARRGFGRSAISGPSTSTVAREAFDRPTVAVFKNPLRGPVPKWRWLELRGTGMV